MQPTEQFFSLHILSSKLVAEISIYMIDPIKLSEIREIRFNVTVCLFTYCGFSFTLQVSPLRNI